MRWILVGFAAFAVFTGVLLAVTGLGGTAGLTLRNVAGLAKTSAIVLLVGLVLVTGPLWLLFRLRIAARPVAWTAVGFISTLVSTALIFALILHIAEGYARMATSVPPAPPTDWGRVALQLFGFGVGGALAYFAGWAAWRRGALRTQIGT